MAENQNWNAKLATGTLIRLTCKGENPFSDKQGYVGDVGADHFIFEVVQNDYEHFSNISAPAITRPYTILFADIKSV